MELTNKQVIEEVLKPLQNARTEQEIKSKIRKIECQDFDTMDRLLYITELEHFILMKDEIDEFITELM